MKNVSDKRFTGNQNTHFMFNNFFFFRKSCRLWYNVEKYCTAGKATDDNMAHAHCVQNTSVYKHTHWICNTDCFSRATMAARTRLSVTLFVLCLSCFHILITARLAGKKWLKIICGFQFSLPLLSKTFPILKRIQRDIILNVCTSSCKVPVILLRL